MHFTGKTKMSSVHIHEQHGTVLQIGRCCMAKILVVDDSKADRQIVANMLVKVDRYEVNVAENGRDALLDMERNVPDLVVTDLLMPKMDGLELVSEARQKFPLVPVVLITSKGSEEIAVQALLRGAASYVPKTLLSRYLTETVRNLLAATEERSRRAKLLGCMQSNACEFLLDNDSSLVPSLVGYFVESLSHIGIWDESERLRASVALDEALVNAMHHGNLEVESRLRQEDDKTYYNLIKERRKQQPYSDRQVHVQVTMSETEVKFIIRDCGSGFDVSSLPDPTCPENLENECGRGVMLMKAFMDEVNYNGKGNQVTMVKRSTLSKTQGH